MKKILIIYTGGTIGMVKDANGLLIPGSLANIKTYINQHFKTNKIDMLGFENPIDSVNFNHIQFNNLLEIIQLHYDLYDGFLVLIGTDTMAYIGSLLSFCIEGLNKPILLTGSQRSLYEINSDAPKNLKGSIDYLMNQSTAGVGIFFDGSFMNATVTTKIDSVADHAFKAVGSFNAVENIEETTTFVSVDNQSILIITIHPFMQEGTLIQTLENNNAKLVVFQNLGSGNNPSFSNTLFNSIQELQKKGVYFVVTTQCLQGGVAVGKYESSNLVHQLNFLDAKTMTLETIVAKSLYLLTKSLSQEEFQCQFESNLRGEL